MPRRLTVVSLPFAPRPFYSYRCRIGRAGHFVVSLKSLRVVVEHLRLGRAWMPNRSVLKGDTLNLWEPIRATGSAAYAMACQPLVALRTLGDDFWDVEQIAIALRAFGFRDKHELDLGVMLRALDSAYYRGMLQRDPAGRLRFSLDWGVTESVTPPVYQSPTIGLLEIAA